jgi:hypothetical protein
VHPEFAESPRAAHAATTIDAGVLARKRVRGLVLPMNKA